jgi:hypothetical protein
MDVVMATNRTAFCVCVWWAGFFTCVMGLPLLLHPIFFSRGKNSKEILQLFKKREKIPQPLSSSSSYTISVLQSPIPTSFASSGRAPGSPELIRYSPVHRSPWLCCLRRSLRPPALGSPGNFTFVRSHIETCMRLFPKYARITFARV